MTTHSSILAWSIPMDRGGAWRATVHGVILTVPSAEQPSGPHFAALQLCASRWEPSRREGGGEMIAELVSSALGLALYLNTLSADFCYDDR